MYVGFKGLNGLPEWIRYYNVWNELNIRNTIGCYCEAAFHAKRLIESELQEYIMVCFSGFEF